MLSAKWFSLCYFGEFGIRSIISPIIDIFPYSHHMSAWYCIDIVRRNSILVTHGSQRVNSVYLIRNSSLSISDQNKMSPSNFNLNFNLWTYIRIVWQIVMRITNEILGAKKIRLQQLFHNFGMQQKSINLSPKLFFGHRQIFSHISLPATCNVFPVAMPGIFAQMQG